MMRIPKGSRKCVEKLSIFPASFRWFSAVQPVIRVMKKIQGQILKSRKNDLQVHQVAIPGWKSFTDVDRWNLQRISPTKKVSVPLLECFCSAKKTHIQSFCRTKERGEWDNLDPLKCVFFGRKLGIFDPTWGRQSGERGRMKLCTILARWRLNWNYDYNFNKRTPRGEIEHRKPEMRISKRYFWYQHLRLGSLNL